MNRTWSPTRTFRVSGPTSTTSDHTQRLIGAAAVAGMTSPPLERRSLSSGSFTRMRSAVRRIFSTASGTARDASGGGTGRSFGGAICGGLYGPRRGHPRVGRRCSVEDGRGDAAPVLRTPPHERGDPEGPLVPPMQGVVPGEAHPAVDLDGPLAGRHRGVCRPGLGRGGRGRRVGFALRDRPPRPVA